MIWKGCFMTRLDRPVVRETAFRYNGRPVVIRLEAGGQLIRLKIKGRRQWHTIFVGSVWLAAVRNTAEDAKKAKRLAREERKRLRKAGLA